MKAKVQYNDLVGTAAADISDFYLNSLNEFLKQRFPNFDWGRYYCLGCKFYTSYGQYPSISFICRDIEDATFHLLQPDEEYSIEEFFNLFKRFSIVIGTGIESIEVNEDEVIQLSKQ